jgi:hypothetical protein
LTVVDPNFAILVDNDSSYYNTPNSCQTTTNNYPLIPFQLTTLDIVGIVVGSSGFIILVAFVYFFVVPKIHTFIAVSGGPIIKSSI